jgi:hypothetical protein
MSAAAHAIYTASFRRGADDARGGARPTYSWGYKRVGSKIVQFISGPNGKGVGSADVHLARGYVDGYATARTRLAGVGS